jgi:hypothetical protein
MIGHSKEELRGMTLCGLSPQAPQRHVCRHGAGNAAGRRA